MSSARRFTPHHTTPQRTTTHHNAPYHNAPQHTIPQRTTTHHNAPYHTMPASKHHHRHFTHAWNYDFRLACDALIGTTGILHELLARLSDPRIFTATNAVGNLDMAIGQVTSLHLLLHFANTVVPGMMGRGGEQASASRSSLRVLSRCANFLAGLPSDLAAGDDLKFYPLPLLLAMPDHQRGICKGTSNCISKWVPSCLFETLHWHRQPVRIVPRDTASSATALPFFHC